MKKGLISKLLTALLVVGLLFSILPSQQAQAEAETIPVYVLEPSWTAEGGGGVWASYTEVSGGPSASPGNTAIYDNKGAGIIKAGLTPNEAGNYMDQGLLAFKLNDVPLANFAAGGLTYDVQNESGTRPVWVRIRIAGTSTTYQHIPESYGVGGGYHTINAGAGLWQLMNEAGNGVGDKKPLSEFAAEGMAIDRVYLTLGMGNSYNVEPGVGTVGWVDKVTIGETTYDFDIEPEPIEIFVDDDFTAATTPGFGVTHFAKIQDGINAAMEGSYVWVAPGTYNEDLNINKAIYLEGLSTEPEHFDFSTEIPLGAAKAPGVWYVDRYRPAAFERVDFDGKSVLHHAISAADYLDPTNRHENTQGRKYDLNLSGQIQSVSIDLFVPEAWKTQHSNPGIWLTGYDGAGVISAYPIIAWRHTATDGPGFYSYDYYLGKWNLFRAAEEDDYNAWHTLKIELGAGAGVRYTVDGAQSDYFDDKETITIGNVILNALNMNADYDVYWNNLSVSGRLPKVKGVGTGAEDKVLNISGSDISIRGLEFQGVSKNTIRILPPTVNLNFSENKVVGAPVAGGILIETYSTSESQALTDAYITNNQFVSGAGSQMGVYVNPIHTGLVITDNIFSGKPTLGPVLGIDGMTGDEEVEFNIFNVGNDYGLFEGFGTLDVKKVYAENTWPEGYIPTVIKVNNVVYNKVAKVSAVYPSTNDINREKGWGHVNLISGDAVARTMTFELVNRPWQYQACVEYRANTQTTPPSTTANYNTEVLDGMWSFVCAKGPNTIQTFTVTLPEGATSAEVRLAFGDEKDERFYWTPFEFIPEVFVDDDFSSTTEGWGKDHFAKIEDGVAAVLPGGKVNVAAGLHEISSAIEVNKPLTILGPQADVDPRPFYNAGSRSPGSDDEAIIDGKNNIDTLLAIKADNVTIKGLEFRNGKKDLIYSDNPATSGTTFGYNIVSHSTGDEGLQFKNVTDAVVEYNYVFDTFGDGLNFSNSTSSIIRFNEVTDTTKGDSNAAIYVGDGSSPFTVVVENNYVHGVGYHGIALGDIGGNDKSKSGGLIKNNLVDGVGKDCIRLGTNDSTAEGNEVKNCGRNGIFVTYNINNATVKRNTITGDYVAGISVGLSDGHDHRPTNVTALFNKIIPNTSTTNRSALFVAPLVTDEVNAEKNWWGNADGPVEGSVIGLADYTPWCTDPECNNFKTMLSLSPEVIGEDASCDGTYTVDVVAQLVENMQAYTVEIDFDEDAIEILSVENKVWTHAVEAFGNTLGNVNGHLIFGAYSQGDGSGNPETFTGTGPLFTITFKAKGIVGETNLVLDPKMSFYTDWPNSWPYDFEKFNNATVKVNSVVTNVVTGKGYCDLGLAISEAGEEGHTLRMDADYTTADGYTIAKKLTLDLNGHNITRAGATDANFFRVNAGGDFTATGTGEIKTTDSSNNTIRIVGSAIGTAKFTLNGPTIDGTNSSVALDGNRAEAPYDSKASYEAIFVMENGKTLETILPLGKGATVVINNGEVRGYAPIQGNGLPQFFGTDITINGGLINGFTEKYDKNGIAIYHPQHGKLTINGGTIIGSNAIEMDAGDLIITGGTITANGDYKDVVDKANHSTDTGDTILVFHRLTYGLADKTVNITISGEPIITSQNAYALREFAPGGNTRLGLLSISGGKFTGAADKGAVLLTTDDTAEEKFLLTDGAYSTDPAVYVYIPLETYLDATDNYYRIKEMDGKLSIPLSGWANYDSGLGWYSGISSEVVLEDALFTGAKSIVVELRAADGTVLQRNMAINIDKYDGFTGFTSPFDINGVFDYVTDAYWTNERIGDFGKTTEPACVVANVVLASGKPLTAENCIITGNREDATPKLVAQDFGIMNFSNVMGYSAGFKPVNFGLHQVTGLKVELFAGTELLQTNVAVQPSDQGNASGIGFSGPFDVFGTFDYTKDFVGGSDSQRVYWENTRQDEYGQTLSPTRVVATATLPGGLEIVVENTNVYGDRAWILPLNVSGVITLQGQRTFDPVPIAFNGIDGRTSTGYVRNFVTTVDGSFSGDVVFHQKYLFTTNQPRYLNITLGLAMEIDIQSATTLPALMLRGGNVLDWELNEINLGDVSFLSGYWGHTGDTPGDANFDKIVNIQDLAMVGGNLNLTAQQAYGTWLLP